MKVAKKTNELNKSFIEDYNARVEEINDEFGGIFDEENEDRIEEITNWLQADRSIINGEMNLMELWNELVRAHDLECEVSTYMLECYQA